MSFANLGHVGDQGNRGIYRVHTPLNSRMSTFHTCYTSGVLKRDSKQHSHSVATEPRTSRTSAALQFQHTLIQAFALTHKRQCRRSTRQIQPQQLFCVCQHGLCLCSHCWGYSAILVLTPALVFFPISPSSFSWSP